MQLKMPQNISKIAHKCIILMAKKKKNPSSTQNNLHFVKSKTGNISNISANQTTMVPASSQQTP